MPNLVDDAQHYQKLLDFLDILSEEEAAYRRRMAQAVQMRTLQLGPNPSDAEIRATLHDWPQLHLDESLVMIENVLRRSGKLHLLLRLAELPEGAADPESVIAALLNSAAEDEIEYYREAQPATPGNVETPPLDSANV